MKKIKLHKGKKYSICSCGLSKTYPFVIMNIEIIMIKMAQTINL